MGVRVRQACGVGLVLAASANETYRRNALNNGLLLIEAPRLAQDLRQWAAGRRGAAPTLRTGVSAVFDFVRSRVTLSGQGLSGSYGFAPVGTVAQEIIVAGGLEGWIRQRGGEQHEGGGGPRGPFGEVQGGLSPGSASAGQRIVRD